MITLKKFVAGAAGATGAVNTVKLYKFGELPEDVQQDLREKEYCARCEDYSYNWDEIKDTLDAIADFIGCGCAWDVGDDGYRASITFTPPESWDVPGDIYYYTAPEDLAGGRALAWIENNIFDGLRVKRHDVIKSWDRAASHGVVGVPGVEDHALKAKDGRPVYLYSRRELPLPREHAGDVTAGFGGAPFTGVCWDCYIYDARKKFIDEVRRDPSATVGRFFEILGDELATAYNDAEEYRLGDGIDDDFKNGGCGGYVSDTGYYLADGTAVDDFNTVLPGYQYKEAAV